MYTFMKVFQKIGIIVVIILLTMFIAKISEASTVEVTTETLNIRKEPVTSSAILGLLSMGDKVEYIGEKDNWYQIKKGDITGYISKDYAKLLEDVPTKEEPTTPVGTDTKQVVVGETKLKSDAKTYLLPLINAPVVGNLKKGEDITVVSIVNEWVYVQTNNVDAWILKQTVEGNGQPVIPNENIPNNHTNTQENTQINNTNTQENTQTNNTNTQGNTETNNTNTQTNTTNQITETTYENRKTMYVNDKSIYVRSGPGTNYAVVDSLTLNLGVIVIGESGDWYKVKLSDKEGYIAKRLLSDKKQEVTSRGEEQRETVPTPQETPASTKGQEIVNFAKQYLGCKYVYGGSGPNTFDCSGFTMYVYQRFGISLSHSAIAQSKKGNYVAKTDLMPGDLVFFTDYETGVGIGHCGIYIGEGNFIHASSGTGYCVKISTLLSGSYHTRYETARRII